jgi:hypothetical protein
MFPGLEEVNVLVCESRSDVGGGRMRMPLQFWKGSICENWGRVRVEGVFESGEVGFFTY